MNVREKDIRWLKRKLKRGRPLLSRQARIVFGLLREIEDLKAEVEKMHPAWFEKEMSDLMEKLEKVPHE